jgi:hypothetical protein
MASMPTRPRASRCNRDRQRRSRRGRRPSRERKGAGRRRSRRPAERVSHPPPDRRCDAPNAFGHRLGRSISRRFHRRLRSRQAGATARVSTMTSSPVPGLMS